jgi:glutaconate CoA-transferase subunit B
MKYRRLELLVLAASGEISNGEICVIGQGIPMVAGALAKKFHAPNAIILTEAGMYDINLFQNMEDIADPGSTVGFSYSIDLFDVFTTCVNRGFIDLCILGAAQIDRYGNVNSTIVGNYPGNGRKDMRLPGSGGANEFAGHCKRTIFTLVGGNFAEKLDYLTTPGWLKGGTSRYEANLPGGPSTVISEQGIFRFDEKTKEIYLHAIFPDTKIEDILKNVPWELKIAQNLQYVSPPTKKQLEFMREFEPFLGVGGHEGRMLQAQVLLGYFNKLSS